MLRRPISNTLLRSSGTILSRAAAPQTRLHDERLSPHATEKKVHGLNVQSEQSQRAIMEKAESSMFTEARGQKTESEKEFKNAPGSVAGMQDGPGGNMPFVYPPPPWNSFGAFVGA